MAENEKPLEMKPATEPAQEVYKPFAEREPLEVQKAKEAITRISIDTTGAKTTEDFAEWYSHATPEEREEYNRNIQESVERIQGRFTDITRSITDFFKSDTFYQIQTTFTGVAEWVRGVAAQFTPADFLFWKNYAESAKDLMPYIREEVKAYQEENGIDELSLTDFMRNIDPETGESIESLFSIIVKRAQDRAAADAAIKDDIEKMARLQALKAEQLESVLPQRYIMPNTPLANSLTGRTDKKTGELIPIINAGEFDMPVMKSGKPGEVTAYTIVTLDPDESGLTISGNFSEYDRCVQNGIATIYEAGNRFFTPEMVYRAMTNKTDSERVSPAQKAAVTKSIEKARRIHTYQDLSDELKKRKLTGPDGKPVSWRVDDYLLNFRRHEMKSGGKTIKAFEFLNEPVLLTHAKLTGQMLSADSRLLDVRRIGKGGEICETIPTTESRQPIKEYLLRRILIMKHDRRNKSPKQDQHILFDSLYRETGIDATNKMETKRAREYALQVLDYWAATGFIAGHETENKGRKLHSIFIKL